MISFTIDVKTYIYYHSKEMLYARKYFFNFQAAEGPGIKG